MKQGLFQLICNSDTIFSKKYKCSIVDEMFEIYPVSNKVMIPRIHDAISEIILQVKFPPLQDHLIWTDNLLTKFIKKIKIIWPDENIETIISNDYIKQLITKISQKMSNKCLFYNLSYEQRKNMSRKEIILVLPIHLHNLIQNPPNFFPIIHINNMFIKLELDYMNLIENSTFIPENIKWSAYIQGSYYDTELRDDILKQRSKIITDQKILKYI